MPNSRFPARYGLLDGLRGIAALGVVLTHHGVVAWGHDAVLVFFIISGYCITAAAHAALERDTGNSVFRYFMWRRLRRIYPPYFLSLVFFAATRLIRNQLTSGAPVPTDALLQAVAAHNAAVAADPQGRTPITQAPFHALGPVRTRIVITDGGLAVNTRHQVLRHDDQPIPRLYAVGATGQGGLLLAGNGHHIGWATTSGRRAGRFIVRGAGEPG